MRWSIFLFLLYFFFPGTAIANYDSLTATVSELATQVGEAAKDKEEAEKKVEDKKLEIAALEGEIARLTEEIARLKSEGGSENADKIAQLTQQRDDLEANLATAKDDLIFAEKDLQIKNNEYIQLSARYQVALQE